MIHIVIGTKAQLIKMAPVMRELDRRGIRYRYLSTGQHRDTIDDLLANFELNPAEARLYDSNDIVSVKSTIYWFLRLFFLAFFKRKKVFGDEVTKNDVVLVHGDTLSTLVGAIMGRLAGLKVGHVESGLRSFRLFHPFPEEITRLLVFRLSHYFFCPDDISVSNLRKMKGVKINTDGNTLYDALMLALDARRAQTIIEEGDDYAIVTLHRYENFSSASSVASIVSLLEIAASQIRLTFVMHKPTIQALKKYKLYKRLADNDNINLIPRMDYFSFISIVEKAEFLISDGGSNQEECFYLGKPVLLLREASERQEGIGENCVISRYDPIVVKDFLVSYKTLTRAKHKLSGSPSSKIVDVCVEHGMAN
ncbi:MAG: UDP-N-acetylglucosamine 2-epimerase (non-hydrolyzing) [Alloalcanivorax sp.]|jgi:UDP-N-acetylglucosamine 2-epimerase (non-hydrolysing)